MRRIVPDIIGTQDPLIMPPTATVRAAALAMRRRHVGAVLVGEGQTLAGIFTERDMVDRVVAEGRDPERTALAEVMTADPDTIAPEASAMDALRRMEDGGYRHLPVVERGRLIGIVSRRDFFGAEMARLEDETELWEKV